MSTVCRILILVLLMHADHAIAGEQSATIEVGGKSICVPAPEGFHFVEMSRLPSGTRKVVETLTAPNNRLLALFVCESDLARIMKGESADLGRSLNVQVFREAEQLDISSTQFQQIVAHFKRQQETLLKNAKDKFGPLLDEASRNLSKDAGNTLKLKVNDVLPLGVFLDRNDAFGFAILTKSQVLAEGQQLDCVRICGICLVRVKGKLLYVYAHYEGPNDLGQVRATATRWVEQILANNMTQGSPVQTGPRNKGNSTSAWDRIIEKGLAGAIVGGILSLLASMVGIVIGVMRRRSAKKKTDDTH